MNDTGSNIQTLYQADYDRLDQALKSRISLPFFTTPTVIQLANGQMVGEKCTAQISVIAPTEDPANPYKILMDWKEQECIVMSAGASCLSSDTMRKHLFFCTPKGNQNLYVADTKTTFFKNMPASE